MKKHYSKTVIAGLALFSMFFGGGNVIFPVLLGEFGGSRLTSATLGFLLASCILPLIGLFAIILYRCDTKAFSLGSEGGQELWCMGSLCYFLDLWAPLPGF